MPDRMRWKCFWGFHKFVLTDKPLESHPCGSTGYCYHSGWLKCTECGTEELAGDFVPEVR